MDGETHFRLDTSQVAHALHSKSVGEIKMERWKYKILFFSPFPILTQKRNSKLGRVNMWVAFFGESGTWAFIWCHSQAPVHFASEKFAVYGGKKMYNLKSHRAWRS
eukprot:Phypoly_transcript_18195.p1 GENE.Phypoly_transcript_18195~~Phypoly_transcript_18195.p1  ORF type:complete len:106 (+),score=7.05 Phypoly_transcript_18195:305-622(+)